MIRYHLLLREIRKVEKEISRAVNTTLSTCQNPSLVKSSLAKHIPVGAETNFEQRWASLEKKIDSRLSAMEISMKYQMHLVV